MKIIGLSHIHDFLNQYPKSKNWLENWIADTKKASWKSTHEIKTRYASCSFLGNNIAIFNVCGNNFRMETMIAYNTGLVIVQWIGTHAEYSRRHK